MNIVRRISPTILVLLVLCATAAIAQIPSEQEDRLASAQAYFELAEFEVALTILDEMSISAVPPDAVGPAIPLRALELRARCLALLGRDAEAVTAFCAVLERDGQWVPDPLAVSPREASIFRQAAARCGRREREAIETEPSSATPSRETHPWYFRPAFVGGVAAAITTIAIVWAQGGEDSPDAETPYFPDPPEVIPR